MSTAFLTILLLTTGFLIPEYYFAVFLISTVIILSALKFRVPYKAINFTAPLLFLIASGAIFSAQNLSPDAMKDIWYVSKIVLISLAGLMLGITGSLGKNWIKWMALAAFLLAAFNVAYSALGLQSDGGRAISYASVFIAPFVWRYFPAIGVAQLVARSVLIALVILMVYISGSRAGVLVLAVSTLAAWGVLHAKVKMITAILAIVALFYIVYPLLPQFNIYNITFLGKIQNSLNEIAFESGENTISMYANWRGFEAYRAFLTWQDSPLPQKIFGSGWGAEIELGRAVYYGSGEVDSLPFAHNGYFTLLVKSGLFGIGLFLFFLVQPARLKLHVEREEDVVFSQILRGGTVVLLLTTIMISGPLNKESLDGLLLVWACAYGSLLRRKRITISERRQLRSLPASHQAVSGPIRV